MAGSSCDPDNNHDNYDVSLHNNGNNKKDEIRMNNMDKKSIRNYDLENEKEFIHVPVTLTRSVSAVESTTRMTSSSAAPSKNEWEKLCEEWGMVINREIYVFENDDPSITTDSNTLQRTETASLSNNNNNEEEEEEQQYQVIETTLEQQQTVSSSKRQEFLVVSSIHQNKFKPAALAGLKVGDIIHSIYGMTNPKLNLLFGIMRDSNSFQ